MRESINSRVPCLAVFLCPVLLLLGACATTELLPLSQTGARYGVAKDERTLIARSNDLERKLRQKGLVVSDPQLQAYIDKVGSGLIPPGATEHIRFRFIVLRDPTINAFALVNGTVGIHSGLLAQLENESQLAHVLAHEIVHIVNRHQLRFLRSAKKKTVTAKIAEMALVPPAAVFGGGAGVSVASLTIGLTYAATVTGYSRGLEEEADKLALVAIHAQGYDIQESPKLFARLSEADDPGAIEGFFYANHPSNKARENYTRDLVESGTLEIADGGVTNVEEYRSATRDIAVRNIGWRLKARHYQYALIEAERMSKRRGDDAALHYLAGEAHRRMAEDPKGAAREEAMRRRERPDAGLIKEKEALTEEHLAKAESEFRRALQMDPSNGRAHRGLGLVAHQRGDMGRARKELEAYLRSGSRIKDRRYIGRLLEEMAK